MTPDPCTHIINDPSGSADRKARSNQYAAVEVTTLVLILFAYGAWLAITLMYARWPLAIVAPLAAVLVTLHSSLQHEIVHGHPTRWGLFNRLLAMVPLALWLPYECYRRDHRLHHMDARLTDPIDDPESYYWTAQQWARLQPITRVLLQIQQTLAGRVAIGSFWSIGRFLCREWRAVRNEPSEVRAIWLEHLGWCLPVVLWIKVVCAMPLWIYVSAIVVPSNGIVLIRSFAEHRAKLSVRQRIAIVEGS